VSLLAALRVAGATQLALAAFHAVLWRAFDWGGTVARLPPLTARVFVVHTGVVVFVLAALGLLSLGWPELLLAPSDLARLLLYAICAFWVARLVLQLFVFDAAMTAGWASAPWVRGGASVLWAAYSAVYGAALFRQIGLGEGAGAVVAPFDFGTARGFIRLGIATVWLVFGLVFKALGALPRHRRIVERVVGERFAGPMTSAVAFAEIGIALWMLVGRALPACLVVQTLMIGAMNALELRYARDLLVSPAGMLCANAVLLALGWYVALGA